MSKAGGRSARSPQGPNPLRGPFMTGFSISEEEIRDLVAFLTALTDQGFLKEPRFGNRWRTAGKR